MKKILILLALILLPNFVKADVFNSNGLIGYWDFNGKNVINGHINDVTVNANTAYPVGIATSSFYTVGKIGQGIMTTASSYTKTATLTFVGALNVPHSFCAWVKPNNTTSSTYGIMSYGEFDDASVSTGLGVSNNLVAWLPNGTLSPTVSSLAVPANKWTFICMVRTTANVFFYANGIQGSASDASSNALGTDPILVGATARNTAIEGQFPGLIDDARAYTRALSATEVVQLYNNGSSIKDVTPIALNAGLVGWWPFDGKTIINGVVKNQAKSTSDGNPGSIATSTFYTLGGIGQGLLFDGIDDIIQLPNNSDYNYSNANNFTITAWIRPLDVTATHTVFSTMDGGGNGGLYFGLNSSGNIQVVLRSAAAASSVNGNSVLNVNKWYHIAVVFTGPTAVTMYLNGVSDGSAVATVNLASVSSLRYIGWNPNVSASFFKGNIDDVRVYNRALSPGEIKQIYTTGSNTFISPNPISTNLLAYWNMDGKTIISGRLTDQSGNGSTGNLLNIATSSFYVPGKIGQGFKFDGVDDKVTLAGVAAGTTFTITAWVNPNAHPTTYGEILTVNTARGLYIKSDKKLTYFDSGDKQCPNLIPDNTWTFVTAIARGSTMDFLVNGVYCSTSAFTVASFTPTNIGNANNNSESYSGGMDEIRLYSTALATSTIQQLYNNGSSIINK